MAQKNPPDRQSNEGIFWFTAGKRRVSWFRRKARRFWRSGYATVVSARI